MPKTLETIVIPGIDTDLLEAQRRRIGELSLRVDLAFREPQRRTAQIAISVTEAQALSGIVNALDAWSDARAVTDPTQEHSAELSELENRAEELSKTIEGLCLGSVESVVISAAVEALRQNWDDHNRD